MGSFLCGFGVDLTDGLGGGRGWMGMILFVSFFHRSLLP